MRPIRTILAVSAASAVALAAAGPASAVHADHSARTTADKNIVETAVATGKFKTLASLLQQAGLAGTLQGKGPYTVFAPTDAAFAKVPKATLDALGKDKAKLRAVLLYHVAKGKLTAAEGRQALVRQDAERRSGSASGSATARSTSAARASPRRTSARPTASSTSSTRC